MSTPDTNAPILLCTVYRSSREPDMFLFVDRREGLTRVPGTLLERLGVTSEVMTLKLFPERRLARAKAPEVLQAIHEQGFYLQLPPDKQALRFTLGE
ncbi:MAG TPA: YcgL domain-containing protein [Hyphomicrobiales bacterium]|nr:YcgL domain-containing protein [Hyphomicrobiales bacterium]